MLLYLSSASVLLSTRAQHLFQPNHGVLALPKAFPYSALAPSFLPTTSSPVMPSRTFSHGSFLLIVGPVLV
jgi:hypothetical protein